ncbi:MAG: ATP-binding protein [Pseudomonadota bacterium]
MTEINEHLQFSISSSFENVADLAEKVSDACGTKAGAHADATDMLRLCLAEALNNIVEHAYGGAEGKPIYADVHLKDSSYEVLLIDEGKPMPDGQVPTGEVDFDETDLSALPEGGFGWMLIRNEMDVIEYERRDGCNVLKLGKDLHR